MAYLPIKHIRHAFFAIAVTIIIVGQLECGEVTIDNYAYDHISL